MKILSATVDELPRECSACPICVQVRSRAPCGEQQVVHGNGNSKTIKVPNEKCLLSIRR